MLLNLACVVSSWDVFVLLFGLSFCLPICIGMDGRVGGDVVFGMVAVVVGSLGLLLFLCWSECIA